MTTPPRRHILIGSALAIIAATGLAVFADQTPTPGAPAAGASAAKNPGAATQPSTRPSAEDVMHELLGQRKENPLIEPARRPPIDQATTRGPHIDPDLVGTAPGEKPAPVQREGQMVMNRRGRAIRSADGTQMVFVFEGDGEKSPEPPMILMPCQTLQDMETTIQERGDKWVFVLSGQIFLYRGVNFLLPTLVKPDVDTDNLKH